jgi:cyclase
MLAKRIVACLDVRDGRTVKGTRFQSLRDAGSPEELARAYCAQGVDEIVVLDVSATLEGRSATAAVVRAIARNADVPVTVGGGVASAEDAGALLEAGADKVAINSAAIADPSLIERAAAVYGNQCVVVAIDALREGSGWRVRSRSATEATPLDAVEWARRAASLGAGEILLTSIDADGTRAGFDVTLTRAVSDAVDVPVVASGGARDADSFAEVLTGGRADAALGASVFHFGVLSVGDVKARCRERGILVRS